MRRRTLLASLLASPLGLALTDRARADAVSPPRDRGDIVSIDVARRILVLRIGRRERRARFTQLTRVTINGSPGAVTDLRPGMQVTARFAASETGRESDMLVAIDASGL